MLMWPRSVQGWLPQWVRFCWLPALAGKRSALKHTRVMIHQPMGGAQGQASDIEITTREIVKTEEGTVCYYCRTFREICEGG